MSKIAFVFPGQGTQYVGMGKELYENNELARQEFDNLFSKLDFDLKTVMFEGPEEVLKETKNTQPAIVSMSLILKKLLEAKGVKADYVAGHSVGEYAAFGAAEYLLIEDTVKLTSARGKFMNEVAEKVNGGMAAIIGLDSDKIIEELKKVDGVVEAVNFNEPKQTVIAGEKLKEEAEKYNFTMTDIKLVANTTANILTSVDEVKDEIYRQSFGPVKWVDTIKKLKSEGVTTIYEIGPGKVLAGLIKKIDKEIEVKNIEKLEDLSNI